MHLETFLQLREVSAPHSVPSIRTIAQAFVSDPKYLKSYQFTEPKTAILVGQVQSGKTGHYLGIAAAVADAEPRFPIFVLLTQSLVALQQQTYFEAKRLLSTFDVFDENDEVSFRHSLIYAKPKMVVIKKTSAPLKKWSQVLNQSLLQGRPLFIIDDEADATGLNTKINRREQSEINRILEHLVNQNHSFLLQVTATPQAIFLQERNSVFRPKSHLYFPPGSDYLGGKFFYPAEGDVPGQAPYTFKATDDAELRSLQDSTVEQLPEGLQSALLTYILTATYRIVREGDSQCNFLLHPSARTVDHNLIKEKVKGFILDTMNSLDSHILLNKFRVAYEDLKLTKPQFPSMEQLIEDAQRVPFNTTVMNSSPGNLSRALPSIGANIFIGGNVLGRGIVIPKLQTIYYCRTAKRLTMDTYWQHSRAFGYDRDASLVRLFMPPGLYSRFVQMSDSVSALFETLETSRTDEIQVRTPRGIAPTRTAVVEDLAGNCIVGGVNHFPVNPRETNARALDVLLMDFNESQLYYVVDATEASSILAKSDEIDLGGVPALQFIEAIKNINKDGKVILAVRRGRAISANTGTLLSPDDRRLSNSFPDDAVIIFYRLTGDASKGWGGRPFWMPNVKLPQNFMVYYK